MKRLLIQGGAIAAATMLAVSAGAVDVINDDQLPYLLVVSDAGGNQEIEIEGGEMLVDVCAECVIEVINVGTVEVSGEQALLIRDGGIEVSD